MCLFYVVELATGIDPVYRRLAREGTGNHHAGCEGASSSRPSARRAGQPAMSFAAL